MAEKEFYLHIDFNSKIDPLVFDDEVYFKIVNLHKKNPLVQVNDYIFQGKYEDCLGTNVYYEEIESNADKNEENPFEQQSNISLKYLTKTNKVLKLERCKVYDTLHAQDRDGIDLKFNEDYETVMKKMKEGSLNIEDLIDDKTEENKSAELINDIKAQECNETSFSETITEQVSETEPQSKAKIDSVSKTIIEPVTQTVKEPVPTNLKPMEVEESESIQVKTNKDLSSLKDIIKQPMKIQKTNDILEESNFPIQGTLNYSVLKQLHLQNLYYKSLPLSVDESKLHLYVDIENSVKNGIVMKTNFQALTEEEKNKLISLNNIENLAAPLQLSLLVNQLKEEKNILLNMSVEELIEVDQYGRTPKERYKVLKYLAKDIWYHIFTRYKENHLMAVTH